MAYNNWSKFTIWVFRLFLYKVPCEDSSHVLTLKWMYWYIVILIHYKVKWKLSLLLTIFIVRWKIFLLMISQFLLMCTYFRLGARCPLTSKKYKCRHLVGFCHQNVGIILCWGIHIIRSYSSQDPYPCHLARIHPIKGWNIEKLGWRIFFVLGCKSKLPKHIFGVTFAISFWSDLKLNVLWHKSHVRLQLSILSQ